MDPRLGSVFAPAALTSAKLPALSAREVQYAMEPGVKLYARADKVCVASFCKLTTHRLIWYEPDLHEPKAWGLSLSRVLNAYTATEGTFRVKSFVVLEIAHSTDVTKAGPVLRLAFKGRGGEDELTEKFKTVLGKRAWEADEEAARKAAAGREGKTAVDGSTLAAPSGKLSAAAGGIAIIHRNQVAKQRANQLMTKEAFADLDALMVHAKKMVDLVSHYTASNTSTNMNGGSGSGSGSGGGGGSASKDNDAFASILDRMGIANPVTRETSGSVYMNELSRQLADFVMRMLDRPDSGGIAQLTDVYCAFNRARGTELVTAEDLLNACKMFAKLSLPLKLARFSSGVLVVQRLEEDGSRVNTKRISDLITERERRWMSGGGKTSWCFVTAASVATALRVSIVVAQAELEVAERKKVVVRDAHVEGVCWYLNRF
jgi:hypothetical protein